MNKIAKIIKYNFSFAYCMTCDGKLEAEKCDGCHRKSMNWACSDDYAQETANAIIEELRKEIPEKYIARIIGPF